MSGWSAIEQAAKETDFDALLKHVRVLRHFNYDRICKNRTGNFYGGIAERLFDRNGDFRNDSAEKLFFAANKAFDIETRNYSDFSGSASSGALRLLGAARSGSETLLLFRNRGGRTLAMGFLRDDGTCPALHETPVKDDMFDGKDDIIARRSGPVAFDGDSVVIADTAGTLHVFDRRSATWTSIGEAAPAPVTSITLGFRRIWMLCGGFTHKAPFSAMISCAFDGSDRQTHFSTARAARRNELDGMKIIWLDSLTVVGRSLFFIVTGDQTAIFRYSPESGEFSRVVTFPFSGSYIDRLWEQDGALYCFTYGHGERIYRIDPAAKKAEWLFNQTGGRYKFDAPDARPATMRGGSQMNLPWIFKDGMLYSANYTPGVIDLADPKASPLLLLPGCAYVFDAGDAVLYLGGSRCFFVRKKGGTPVEP
ncbi:hypothetical protein SDC9_130160 [bioreactor metagenome]|uniref:Uncharacterized protein n=1 Tax=bioreactor metagenome TaxID=1076179 RepID=A0A645D1K5_9ZZZZ